MISGFCTLPVGILGAKVLWDVSRSSRAGRPVSKVIARMVHASHSEGKETKVPYLGPIAVGVLCLGTTMSWLIGMAIKYHYSL